VTSTSWWDSPKEDGGLLLLLWGLAALVMCILTLTNFRGFADWLARRKRSVFKTHQQAVRFNRCFCVVFAIPAVGAIILGVYRIAHGDL
jgi:hypothetical protein